MGTDKKKELGQLTGRIMKNNLSLFGGGADNTSDRAKAEWVVQAPAGSGLRLVPGPLDGSVQPAVRPGEEAEIRLTYRELSALIEDAIRSLR